MFMIDEVSCVGHVCDKQMWDTFRSLPLSGMRIQVVINTAR